MPPQPCDLLLSGGLVVTMAEPNRLIWPGSVAIRGRDIVGVGPTNDLAAQWRPSVTLDCSAQAILPGLVNCHVHAGMSLLKSRAGDRPFRRRLQELIWPFAEAMTEDASYIGTRLGCLEMMKAGVTTFADMWPFPAANAEAVKSMGLRAVLAPYGRAYAEGEPEALATSAQRWNDDRLAAAIGIQYLFEWTHETLRKAAALAEMYGLRIHMHAADIRAEVAGGHNLAEVDAIGLLRPGTILADCVHLTPEEIDLAGARGAGAALTPVSSAKLGTGFAPLAQLKACMPVGLGTDSVCSNDRHDLFDEMRVAILAGRGRGEADALSAEDALRLATAGGARVLGINQRIGSLEVGKRADVITIDLDDPRFVPLHRERREQVIAHLVFVASCTDVDTVIGDGQILVREGKARNLDETDIMRRGQEISRTCLAKAGLA
jgi:5-methylthioadenosine/S-adenosylhomocysteine deaminase